MAHSATEPPARLRLNLRTAPGQSEAEVWPGRATVADVQEVLAARLGRPQRAITLKVERTGQLLEPESTLGVSGLADGDTLAIVDLDAVRSQREGFVARARAAIEHGYLAGSRAAQVARARDEAGLTPEAAAEVLTGAGLPAEWVGPLARGAAYDPPAVEEYRKVLEGIRGKELRSDVVRHVTRRRRQLGLSLEMHQRIGRDVGIAESALARLAKSPEPTDEERTAYTAALSRCRGPGPPPQALHRLGELTLELDMDASEHDLIALELGLSLPEARALWQRVRQPAPPPGPGPTARVPAAGAPAAPDRAQAAGGLAPTTSGPARGRLEAGDWRPEVRSADSESPDSGLRSPVSAGPAPGGAVTPADTLAPSAGKTPLTRPAALEQYRDALRGAWLDQSFSPQERQVLAALRQRHGIGDTEHMELAAAVGIPPSQARDALADIASPWLKRLVLGVIALAAITAIIVFIVAGDHRRLAFPRPSAARPAPRVVATAREGSPVAVPHARKPAPRTASSSPEPDVADPTGGGILHLESEPPGATVKIDGIERGVTPVAVAVGAGRHRVSYAKDGHWTIVKEVDVDEGDNWPGKARLGRRTRPGRPTRGEDEE